ncbi:MAG: hypothetical protein JWQ14_355 [Adhaeribacter sp.]|nr:hypothetical protein [Adhaeribacter sp.]
MFWFGILLALGACNGKAPPVASQAAAEKTTRQTLMHSDKPPDKATLPLPGPAAQPDRISPGSCRLVGEVVSVLPDLEADKNTPCGQVPCRVVIKILRILGYGSAFRPSLTQGQEIKVYFQFTLSSTQRYFPELTGPLPGLKIGDIFQADVTGPGDRLPAAAWFQVYNYTVIK